jgi:hypothetical protein
MEALARIWSVGCLILAIHTAASIAILVFAFGIVASLVVVTFVSVTVEIESIDVVFHLVFIIVESASKWPVVVLIALRIALPATFSRLLQNIVVLWHMLAM